MDRLAIVILAGGKGSRMKSDLPKVLISTREKPVILHVLSTALALTPERCIVVTGYKRELVEEVIQKECGGASVIKFAEQREPKGTGDAAKAALPALKGFQGTVLILYGDAPLIRPQTLSTLLSLHKKESATVTVFSFVPSDPKSYGRVIRDSKTGKPIKIVETKDCTPDELLVRECNSGIYAVDSSFLEPALNALTNNNAQGEYYFTDIFERAAKEGQNISAFIAPDPHEAEGINTPYELAQVNHELLERTRRELLNSGVILEDPNTFYADASVKIAPGVVIGPSVHLRGTTTIGSGVIIEGHAYLVNVTVGAGTHLKFSVRAQDSTIGDNAQIGPFSNLRPGTNLSEGVHIGNFVETKKAILGAGTKANHLSYLGDCTIGAKTNIGAGTITCNYDGYNKFKTEIGSGVFIGSHTALVAPVTIEDGASIGAGSVITKKVESDALAFTRAPLIIKPGWAKAKRERSLKK